MFWPSSVFIVRRPFPLILGLLFAVVCSAYAGETLAESTTTTAEQAQIQSVKPPKRPPRVLLLGQKPDGHPVTTHEYMAGMGLIAKCLQQNADLQTLVIQADSPWKDGPALLEGADAVVLFLSQGARWLQEDRQRLQAFEEFARRGGGLAVVHWGMGTRQAKDIDSFVKLFGGCHGGPDRRYKILTTEVRRASKDHPVLNGVEPFRVHEEFYYRLKFTRTKPAVTPLLTIAVEDNDWPVAWSWQRQDGGRSFGFSGGHYHKNWQLPEYRRLVTQGVLWTLKLPIPASGAKVDVTAADLQLPSRQPKP